MPTSSVWSMADRLLDGKLAQRLAELRAEGYSAEAITRALFAEAGVHVSSRTVAKWCHQIGVDDDEPTAAAVGE